MDKTKRVQERPGIVRYGGDDASESNEKGQSVDANDKLLSNGWLVQIRNFAAELSLSAPGICLASTAEGKKFTKMKGDQPLVLIVYANIIGTGKEVHVLVEYLFVC